MKKLLFLPLIAFACLVACNNAENENNESDSLAIESVDTAVVKTYAEISIKEGGEWKEVVKKNGNKQFEYQGGTFKNVESLKTPEQHTDHSFFIRYEGPGWESNKVGYRLYLDWRNGIDIFGKITDSMILSQVGQDGFDSYHEMCNWGTDILKVGKGLGIGSIGRYVNNEVLHFKEVDSTLAAVENAPENSKVKINYFGWKTQEDIVDLSSELAIAPDQRYTKHTIQASKAIEGICTGIVNHKVEVLKKESENKKWAYLATYGEQTLVPDNLGMAIFYQTSDIESQTDWEHDHLLIFKPTTEAVSFYFLGAWEQEKDGIKTKEAFVKYLDEKLAELNANDNI